MSSPTFPANGVFDVVVVGGGAGGSYAAWRLITQAANSAKLRALRNGDAPLSLALLEGSGRIGGRLWSYVDRRFPDLTMELGGQGFSELQQNVFGLCARELKLAIEPCSAFNLGPQLQYQRSHRFPYQAYSPLPPDPAAIAGLPKAQRGAKLAEYRKFAVGLSPSVPSFPIDPGQMDPDAIKSWCVAAQAAIQRIGGYYPDVVPYFLRDDEKRKDPAELLMNVILSVGPDVRSAFNEISDEVRKNGASPGVFSRMNELQAMLRTIPAPVGDAIEDRGFWNACAAQLSTEAFQMAGAASFASSSIGNWNLYDSSLGAIWGALMYQMQTPFYSVSSGYDRLPKTLVERFQSAGGQVLTSARVLRIDVDDSNGERLVRLTVCSADNPASRSIVSAKFVIAALSKRALELIRIGADDPINPQFLADVSSVEPVPASKVFMVYPTPWWQHTPVMSIKGGYSTTDLPVRACYYMQTAANGYSLVLTSLNDEEADTFWSGYARDPLLQQENLNVALASQPLGLPNIARDLMSEEVQRQLAEFHGVRPPDPLSGPFYFNWVADPFGGGWHNWRPCLKSWEVMPRIRTLSRPEDPDPRIFLCGEAWSNQQGWVEGALNTTEMVLETHFGLPRPGWVASSYDFGP
ncbi:MAG TPA: FAD-dependent oxidoreductase [Bryobacteraceae bacterium]|nr:FAD-dependent oxidoreductase [Bryobacteraceae bacterium]